MFERQSGRERSGRFNKVVGIVLGILLVGAAAAMVAQSFVPKPEQRAAWDGPGAEPAARKWAVRLEPSLRTACYDAFQPQRDKRAVIATVAQQIGPAVPLTNDEAQEVLSSIANRDEFVGGCLVQTYRAIEPCAAYAADLAAPAARTCVASVLSRTVWAVPYELCSVRVQSDRLRRACAASAEEARRRADEALRKTTAG